MASFNFVDAASKGYRFLWDERRIIIPMAMLPLAIKIITFIGIMLFEIQRNALRQGLVLLPAYFFEGWLVACAVRMAIFGERVTLPSSKRSIGAAMAVYLLTKLGTSFFAGVLSGGKSASELPEPAPNELFMMFILLMIMIWAFRFLWLYVPMAMDAPVGLLLRKIKGYTSSFSILGLWILFIAPMLIITIGFADMAHSLFPDAPNGERQMPYILIVATAQAIMETAIAIMAAVGMAHGFKEILTGQNKKTPLF